MEHKQKKLARNAVVYSIFSLLQRGLGFFLLPVYTTVLSSSELGILSTSTAVISFMVLFFGLSLRGSTAYYYYEYKDERPDYLKRLYGTNLSFILLVSLGGVALLLLFKPIILDRLFLNIAFWPYVVLSLISILLQPVYFFYQSYLKARQMARKAATLDFVYFIGMISLTLVFILGMGMNAEGALLANAIASFLVFAISLVGLSKQVTWCLSRSLLSKSLKYSLPLLPHNLSGWAMNLLDRVLLNNLGSLSLVGLFDVGAQLGKVVNMIALGVNSAYSPWFFDQVKNEDRAGERIVQASEKIVLLYALVAVGISWFAPEILELIAKPEYQESWKVVPLIAIAFVLNGFYFTFSNVFFLDKTRYLPLLSISGALVNLLLNIWLIPIYGIMGAALASLLTKAGFTVLTYVVSQRLYFIPYRILRISLIVLLGASLSGTVFIVQPLSNELGFWQLLGLKVLLMSIFSYWFIKQNWNGLKAIVSRK